MSGSKASCEMNEESSMPAILIAPANAAARRASAASYKGAAAISIASGAARWVWLQDISPKCRNKYAPRATRILKSQVRPAT